MISKNLVDTFRGVVGFGFLILVLVCVGCGGGGDSSNPEPESASLSYDSTYTSVTGEVKIKIEDLVSNSHVTEEVVLQDFVPALGDCPLGEYTITPDSLTFTSEIPQTLSIVLATPSRCYADTLTLTATKVVNAVQSGKTIAPDVSTMALGFPIPVAAGAGTHAGAYSIQFVSADPTVMALAGMGGAGQSENALVSFMVKDKQGSPMVGEPVSFALTTSVGGLSLTTDSAVSNDEGLVTVNVLSGNVSTSVAVIATLSVDGSVSTQSSMLTVNTGLPDQNSFSLSIDTSNPEGLNYDGETITFTIRAADHLNNPVPDGTTVYFSTEGGAIEPSCSTVNGACSVVWTSQDPRPLDGRVTVLATAIGSESFTDANGNGFFDPGETFCDLSEAFRDDDESGVFDQWMEEFWDFNENGIFDSANGIYNGFRCSGAPGCTFEQVHVRESMVITMSGSHADISFSPAMVDLKMVTTQDVEITVQDVNGNVMPKGTTVNLETTNGTIAGSSSYTVGSSNRSSSNPDENMKFTVSIGPDDDEVRSGLLTVEVTTPNDDISTASIPVLD